MSVLNRDCFAGGDPVKAQKYYKEALGFSVQKDGMGSYNGGIVNPQREHLKVGNRHYRFVSAGMPHGRKIGGTWWIEHETFIHIYQRFRSVGANPNTPISSRSAPVASVFREWLALTFEWNLIEEVIVADLQARIDAYTGAGRLAAGKHVMDNRAFGYAPHLSNIFTIKQLFIPELWVHQSKAFPAPEILPLSKIETLLP